MLEGSAPIGRLESNQECSRPVRRTTGINNRTQKTGPMCISRGLLEPCAHGAGLIVAAYPARWSRYRGGLGFGKPRAYFFIFLVFLATFLVALAVFFAFFAFFAMSSSWVWLA